MEAHKGIMPLKVFHFGGDEVAKGAWENSTACDELFRSGFDFRDFKDLKEYFVRQVTCSCFDLLFNEVKINYYCIFECLYFLF